MGRYVIWPSGGTVKQSYGVKDSQTQGVVTFPFLNEEQAKALVYHLNHPMGEYELVDQPIPNHEATIYQTPRVIPTTPEWAIVWMRDGQRYVALEGLQQRSLAIRFTRLLNQSNRLKESA
jgi:hypothetical protein